MIIENIVEEIDFTISFKDIIEESKYPYIQIVLECFDIDFSIKDNLIKITNCDNIIMWEDMEKYDDLSILYNNGKTLSNNLIKLSRHLKSNDLGYSYINQPVVIYKDNDFFIIPMDFDLIHNILNNMITINTIEKTDPYLPLELKHVNELPYNQHFKLFYSSIGLILYDYLFTWNNSITDAESNINKLVLLPLHYILKICLLEKNIEQKVICYI